MIRYEYTDDSITLAVKESFTVTDVLRKLGMRVTGGQHAHISRRIKKLGLDTSHFKSSIQCLSENQYTGKKHWKECLVHRIGSDHRQSGTKLSKWLKESGREYICDRCDIGDKWNYKKLVLEVDHINGDWTDDRPENLAFLCPNCHSQKK